MSIVDFPSAGTIGTSLKPKRYDIENYQGDTFAFSLTLTDAAQAPVNITGWTVLAQIKDVQTSAPAPTPSFDVTLTPTQGIITIGLTAASSSALPEGAYKYDIQVSDTAGNKRTYIGGLLTVTEDVSE